MKPIPKRGPGRPPAEEPEDDLLQVRVSKPRKTRYAAAAARAGQTLSAWIKKVLDRNSR